MRGMVICCSHPTSEKLVYGDGKRTADTDYLLLLKHITCMGPGPTSLGRDFPLDMNITSVCGSFSNLGG